MINKIRSLVTRLRGQAATRSGQQIEIKDRPRLEWTEHDNSLHVHPVTPESERILERSLQQWESAEWSSLSHLEIEIIKQHPQRARLALLAAAGKLQSGELDSTRVIINIAKQWGASREMTARVLLSGAHETLGRASLIAGQKDRALKNFRSSAVIGSPESDPDHLLKRRLAEFSIADTCSGSMLQLRHLGKTEPSAPGLLDSKLTAPINGREVSCRMIEYGAAKFNFYFRLESKGDIGVIKQIFEEKQYEFGWLPQGKLTYSLHQRILKSGKKPLILDGGANIGASCIWFDIKFPGSAILAVEPSDENCELIERNCCLRNVSLYCGAIADKPRNLTLHDPGESDWGFRVNQHGDVPVPCQSIVDLLKSMDSNLYEPFILKLDIEGGEALVFEGDCDWMNQFALIVVELHDWMLPNQGTSANFLKAVARHGFEIVTRGENIFCFNRKLYL